MRGSIVRRGPKSWAAVVSLGRDPATGRVRQKWYSHKTRGEAQAHLAQILAQVAAGTWQPPTKVLVADYLERWLRDYAEGAVAATTLPGYRRIVRTHLAPHFIVVPLAALSAQGIQEYLATKARAPEVPGEEVRRHLLARAARHENRDDPARAVALRAIAEATDPAKTYRLSDAEVREREGPRAWRALSATTVRQHHAVLHRALENAVRWGLVVRNVADLADPPRGGTFEAPRPWDAEEVRLFLGAAKRSSRYHALYVTAILTGLRMSEILGLRWSDVDLGAGVVRIAQTFHRVGAQRIFKGPKSRSSRRAVALPPAVVDALRTVRAEQAEAKAMLGDRYEDHDLVFAQATGKPEHAHNIVERDFKPTVRRAKVPMIRFHDLRHLHASHLALAGVPVKVAAERLGHSNPALTIRLYQHTFAGQQAEAAALVEDRLLKGRLDQGLAQCP